MRLIVKGALALLALYLIAMAVAGQVPPSRPGTYLAVFFGILLGVPALTLWAWMRWRKRRRMRVAHLKDLLALTPDQFEQAIADLLTDLGYRHMQRVGGTGDLGADLIGRDPNGRSVVVQCKRYAPGAHVGTPDIQTFIGMVTVHHRADRGVFVTTAAFSAPAVDLASAHDIELMDGARLGDLLEQVRPR